MGNVSENILPLLSFLRLMMPFIAIADGHKAETRIEKRVIVMEAG